MTNLHWLKDHCLNRMSQKIKKPTTTCVSTPHPLLKENSTKIRNLNLLLYLTSSYSSGIQLWNLHAFDATIWSCTLMKRLFRQICVPRFTSNKS